MNENVTSTARDIVFHERTHKEDILAEFSTSFCELLNNNGGQWTLSLHNIAFDWCFDP